jgi:transcriptional antiterminator Rof (Rho-off)
METSCRIHPTHLIAARSANHVSPCTCDQIDHLKALVIYQLELELELHRAVELDDETA